MQPASPLICEFIDEHCEKFGIVPICRALAVHGVQIAPRTYWRTAWRRRRNGPCGTRRSPKSSPAPTNPAPTPRGQIRPRLHQRTQPADHHLHRVAASVDAWEATRHARSKPPNILCTTGIDGARADHAAVEGVTRVYRTQAFAGPRLHTAEGRPTAEKTGAHTGQHCAGKEPRSLLGADDDPAEERLAEPRRGAASRTDTGDPTQPCGGCSPRALGAPRPIPFRRRRNRNREPAQRHRHSKSHRSSGPHRNHPRTRSGSQRPRLLLPRPRSDRRPSTKHLRRGRPSAKHLLRGRPTSLRSSPSDRHRPCTRRRLLPRDLLLRHVRHPHQGHPSVQFRCVDGFSTPTSIGPRFVGLDWVVAGSTGEVSVPYVSLLRTIRTRGRRRATDESPWAACASFADYREPSSERAELRSHPLPLPVSLVLRFDEHALSGAIRCGPRRSWAMSTGR